MTVRRVGVCGVCLATIVGAAHAAAAQSPIPIRQVAPAEARSTETLGIVMGLRELADGRVMVNDPARQRLIIFDSTLSTYTTSADANGTGVRSYPRGSTSSIYPYLGDSALFVDMTSRTFVVIEPDGSFGHAMAHPRPWDLFNVIQRNGGSPGIDARGRFVYQGSPSSLPTPASPAVTPTEPAIVQIPTAMIIQSSPEAKAQVAVAPPTPSALPPNPAGVTPAEVSSGFWRGALLVGLLVLVFGALVRLRRS